VHEHRITTTTILQVHSNPQSSTRLNIIIVTTHPSPLTFLSSLPLFWRITSIALERHPPYPASDATNHSSLNVRELVSARHVHRSHLAEPVAHCIESPTTTRNANASPRASSRVCLTTTRRSPRHVQLDSRVRDAAGCKRRPHTFPLAVTHIPLPIRLP
jgi:hypothetical protein